MTIERYVQRKLDFQKAVGRLEEACAQPESSFVRGTGLTLLRGLATAADSWGE